MDTRLDDICRWFARPSLGVVAALAGLSGVSFKKLSKAKGP